MRFALTQAPSVSLGLHPDTRNSQKTKCNCRAEDQSSKFCCSSTRRQQNRSHATQSRHRGRTDTDDRGRTILCKGAVASPQLGESCISSLLCQGRIHTQALEPLGGTTLHNLAETFPLSLNSLQPCPVKSQNIRSTVMGVDSQDLAFSDKLP